MGSVLPASLDAADVTGDNHPDIVCCGKTNTNIGFIRVFVGDTLGGFAPIVDTTPSGPVATAGIADFDGDGKLDVVAGIDNSPAAGNVTIHLGNNLAAFAAAGTQTLVGRPGKLVIGDINTDGKLDVIAIDFVTPGSGVAKLMLGDGLGGLGAPSAVANANNEIQLVDMNNDGKRDLVVASDGNPNFKTYLGDGIGGFGAPISTATPAVPDGLAIGDVNGDGNKDVVVTLIFQGGIRCYLGNGSGGFGAGIVSNALSGFTRLALGDIDGDGNLDIGGDLGASSIGTFLGNGAGGFGNGSSYAAGFLPRGFIFADFDDDERLDMAAVNLAIPGLSTFINYVAPVGISSYGTGTPGCDGTHTLTGNKTPFIGTTDFQLRCDNAPLSTLGLAIITNSQDLAGSDPFAISAKLHVDLFFATETYVMDFFSTAAGNALANVAIPYNVNIIGAQYYAQGVWVWFPGCPQVAPFGISTTRGMAMTIQMPGADATIAFDPAVNVAAGSSPSSAIAADVNIDGNPDLIVTNGGTTQASILLGTGGTSFAAPTAVTTGQNPRSAVAGDFNADGKVDFATADTDANALSILLGDGLGGFTAGVSPAAGTAPVSVASADINNDGLLDLAVANRDSNDVILYIGDGLGGFTAGSPIATSAAPLHAVLRDVSSDGKRDLFVVCNGAGTVESALGDGLGGFAAFVPLTVGTAPTAMSLGDVNGDGKLDLACANSGSSNVSLLIGDGLGAFAAATSHSAGTFPTAVRIVDANADVRADILVANRDSNNVSVLLGNNSATPIAAQHFAVGTAPVSLDCYFPDFTGRIRIVTANQTSNDVTILVAQ
jgi:hypothetical protein